MIGGVASPGLFVAPGTTVVGGNVGGVRMGPPSAGGVGTVVGLMIGGVGAVVGSSTGGVGAVVLSMLSGGRIVGCSGTFGPPPFSMPHSSMLATPRAQSSQWWHSS